MSESDTMFNEQDRRCTAVQLMLSTDPTYDNRIITSTLKMQIRMVQCLRAQLNASDDPLEMVEQKPKLEDTARKTQTQGVHQKGPGNPWWNSQAVWWSPGAIRWPVADPGCGSMTWRRPTSPKRPRLGFRTSATTLYPSLTIPLPLPTWTRWTTSFGHMSRTSPTWPPTAPKPAWSPPSAEYSLSSRWRL